MLNKNFTLNHIEFHGDKVLDKFVAGGNGVNSLPGVQHCKAFSAALCHNMLLRRLQPWHGASLHQPCVGSWT